MFHVGGTCSGVRIVDFVSSKDGMHFIAAVYCTAQQCVSMTKNVKKPSELCDEYSNCGVQQRIIFPAIYTGPRSWSIMVDA